MFPLGMQQELQQLRTEVSELRGALANLSKSVGENAPIPGPPLVPINGQQYTHVQFIPLMMYSGPEPEGDEEPPRYGTHPKHTGYRRTCVSPHLPLV